jgi:hypothetical protein
MRGLILHRTTWLIVTVALLAGATGGARAVPFFVQVQHIPPILPALFNVQSNDLLQTDPLVAFTLTNLDAPGGVNVLRNGLMAPPNDPNQNVFPSNANTNPATLLIDLGGPHYIQTVITYSHHTDATDTPTLGRRAPQVFTLLASQDGALFDTLATVDTRPAGFPGVEAGGQWMVQMSDPSLAPVPSTVARYLRLDIQRNIPGDPLSGTYFSEIDVSGFAAPEPGALGLAGLAGGAAGTRRRRRQSA